MPVSPLMDRTQTGGMTRSQVHALLSGIVTPSHVSIRLIAQQSGGEVNTSHLHFNSSKGTVTIGIHEKQQAPNPTVV